MDRTTIAELLRTERPSRWTASQLADALMAGPQAAASLASGMVAQPISGLAGLFGLGGGPEMAANAVGRVQDMLTYQPANPYAQRVLGGVSEVTAPIGRAFEALRQKAGDAGYAVAGPVGGAVGAALPDAAAMVLPFAGRLARNAQVPATLGKERGIFAGVGAKTADLSKFEEAQRLAKAGASPDDIWNRTGWFQGADKKWRFEIDDSNSMPGHSLYSWGEAEDLKRGNSAVVRRQKALLHPELSAAYPETKALVTYLEPGREGGSFDPEAWRIRAGASRENGAANRSTMLHEVQHAVQDREGFGMGGSPEQFTQQAEAQLARDALSWRNELLRLRKDMPQADWSAIENRAIQQYQQLGAMDMLPSREARDLARQPNVLFPQHYPNASGGFNDLQELVSTYALDQRATPLSSMEAYRRLAGEAEARAVQSRMNLTPEQRRALPPWQSYDVPVEQQIVRFK